MCVWGGGGGVRDRPIKDIRNSHTELQIRKRMEDNSKIIFHWSSKACGPSLEPSQRDSSNDGSQSMFFYGEIWLIMEESFIIRCRGGGGVVGYIFI